MVTKQEIRDYFAKFGKQGGKATARNRTAEQRSEAARKAVQARWAKIDASLKEMNEGLAKLEAKQKARSKRAKEKKARNQNG
jgi:hypothetical protein